jgi:hypothetical protein
MSKKFGAIALILFGVMFTALGAADNSGLLFIVGGGLLGGGLGLYSTWIMELND